MLIYLIMKPIVAVRRIKVFVIFLLGIFTSNWVIAQKVLHVLSKSDHTIYSYVLNEERVKEVLLDGKNGQLYAAFDIEYLPDSKELIAALPKRDLLRAVKTDDKSIRQLSQANPSAPIDIEIDAANKHLYWLNHVHDQIYRSDLTGENRVLIVEDSLNLATGLAISPKYDRLFWTDISTGKIYSSTLAGQEIRAIIDELVTDPLRLAVNEATQEIYWTDDQHRVGRAKFDGSEAKILFEGREGNHPFAILLDEESRKLYWSDYGDQTVKRSNWDGSDLETVVSNISEPVGLVLTDLINQPIAFNGPNLSANQRQFSEINIYPNPTEGMVNVALKQELTTGARLQILDEAGHLIREFPGFRKTMSLDLSDLPKGHYSCRILHQGQVFLKSFILAK